MKQIWSGTWSSGSITVSELPYYNFFLITSVTSAMGEHKIIARRNRSGQIAGGKVVWEREKSAWHGFDFTASLTSSTVLKTLFSDGPIHDSWINKSGWSVGLPVTKIEGIL